MGAMKPCISKACFVMETRCLRLKHEDPACAEMFAGLGRAVLGAGGCRDETSAVLLQVKPILGCPGACRLECRRSRAAPLFQGAGRRPMLKTTNKAAEEAASVLHAAHAHTTVTLQLNHGRGRQGLWTPKALTPLLATLHFAITNTDTEEALPPSPVYTASWKDLPSLQAGRNPPCPSKAFSSPNIVFISPSPPFLFSIKT